MGRWAQRTRQGGSAVVFNRMIDAAIGGSGSDQVEATYMTTQGLTALQASDFTSQSSGEVGDSIAGISGPNVTIQFLNPLSGDTDVTYTGNAAGFITPQTIIY